MIFHFLLPEHGRHFFKSIPEQKTDSLSIGISLKCPYFLHLINICSSRLIYALQLMTKKEQPLGHSSLAYSIETSSKSITKGESEGRSCGSISTPPKPRSEGTISLTFEPGFICITASSMERIISPCPTVN